jgi:hypothetical protein
MKTICVAFFLFLAVHVFGQFPAPTNLIYSMGPYFYNDGGNCLGRYFYGIGSCSQFVWNAPVSSQTIDHYNIYWQHGTSEPQVLGTPSSTYCWFANCFIGTMWITAVYSNPTGESGPSNIISNLDIAIEVRKVNDNFKIIFYIDNSDVIHLQTESQLKLLKIFDSNGQVIKTVIYPSKAISIIYLIPGFYIAEVVSENGDEFRQKFIK